MLRKNIYITLLLYPVFILLCSVSPVQSEAGSKINNYRIADTGQEEFFNNYQTISKPSKGQPFYGQDAQFTGNKPFYKDNVDGTITDMVTGLMWQKSYEVMSYQEAVDKVKTFSLAGHRDWRLPGIKEVYSLIMFSGVDVSSREM